MTAKQPRDSHTPVWPAEARRGGCKGRVLRWDVLLRPYTSPAASSRRARRPCEQPTQAQHAESVAMALLTLVCLSAVEGSRRSKMAV